MKPLSLSPRLDPILYKKCQGDAARLCHTHGWNETSELMPPGAVFSCLYRHAYRTEEQGRRVRLETQTLISNAEIRLYMWCIWCIFFILSVYWLFFVCLVFGDVWVSLSIVWLTGLMCVGCSLSLTAGSAGVTLMFLNLTGKPRQAGKWSGVHLNQSVLILVKG